MRDFPLEQIRALLRHAWERAPGWRNWLDECGMRPELVQSEADYGRIPVLRKQELPRLQRLAPPFAGLAASPEPPPRIFLSPGPIYDPQTYGEDPWRFAPALKRVGFGRGDVVINAFSYHLSPAGFMFDTALRSLGATVAPTGTGNTELLVGMLRHLAVNGYVGTPGYFRTLLARAEQEGLVWGEHLSLAKAFFTAEKLPEDLPGQCEERGIAFGEAYGTADAGCIAWRMHPEEGFRVSRNVWVEICDPATGLPLPEGEVGEVVLTLFDHYYPLIRFGTGDLSRWLSVGGEVRLAGVLGRVGDGLKVRGMFIYRGQVEQVLSHYPQVRHFQAEVTREDGRDRLRIAVEAVHAEASLAERLAEHFREVLRVRAEVDLVAEGTLNREEPQLVDRRSES